MGTGRGRTFLNGKPKKRQNWSPRLGRKKGFVLEEKNERKYRGEEGRKKLVQITSPNRAIRKPN